MPALFGPAGNSASFESYAKTSVKAPGWLRAMGLTAYEYQCGHGVSIGEKTARALGEEATKHGIALSMHAPYYISLTNPEKLEANLGYIRKSAQAADWMGAGRIIIHAGSAGGGAGAFEGARGTLFAAQEMLEDTGLGHIVICVETMGKRGQFGDLEEVAALCAEHQKWLPCVDFGHLNARGQGVLNEPGAAEKVLDTLESALGFERIRRLHIHFSHIQYGQRGEIRHLTFEDSEYGPDFAQIAAALRARGYEPVAICESAGKQAEDALIMRDVFFGMEGAS